MAEPIGITASIITLLTLTSQAINCVKSWTTADRNAQRLAKELADLQNLLKSLNELIQERSEELSTLLQHTGPDATFDQLQKILNVLIRRLDACKSSRFERLKWPLKEKEIENMLEAMKRQKLALHLALDVDETYVLEESETLQTRIFTIVFHTGK